MGMSDYMREWGIKGFDLKKLMFGVISFFMEVICRDCYWAGAPIS